MRRRWPHDDVRGRVGRAGPELVLGRKNWLFTWQDDGGIRTASIRTFIATCIAHDVNPRDYLHCVTKLIVQGWPHKELRELLPGRIVVKHPKLSTGPELPALPL